MPIKIKECELSILFLYRGQQRVESVDFLSCPYVKFLGLFYQVIIIYIYFIYSFSLSEAIHHFLDYQKSPT